MNVRGIKTAELFKLRGGKSLAVTLGRWAVRSFHGPRWRPGALGGP